MNRKAIIENTFVAFGAQGFSMLLSVMQSLIIPKHLGLEQFGYWQLFIFYAGYVGFFHLGLNDGMYLLMGGTPRGEVDRSSAHSLLLAGIVFQGTLAILLVSALSSLGLPRERFFVIVCTCVYLVVYNAASFLMSLLQAMNETKLSSFSTIVNRASFLLPMVFLLFARSDRFEPFVLAYVTSAALQLIYCCWHCRDILASSLLGFRRTISEALTSVRVGSKLMLANIASFLVLGVLRYAIDAKWGIKTFGKLSFSLSLVNFFLAFVSQAAMVLFPALRQSGSGEVRVFYQAARDALGLVFPVIYLLYFPMVWLLGLWLPAYADSLHYFAYLIPICVFDSKMNITCTTMFKVRRQEGTLLKVNVLTTVACAVMVVVGVFAFESVEISILCATIAIMGRSVFSERLVSQDLHVPYDDISAFEVALTVAFIGLALLASPRVALVSYAILYAFFLFLHRRQVLALLSLAKR